MNKDLLIRHIHGLTSPEEDEKILTWMEESEQNGNYYQGLVNLLAAESISRPSGGRMSQGDLNDRLVKTKDMIAKGQARTETRSTSINNTTYRNHWRIISTIAVAAVLILSIGLNVFLINKREKDITDTLLSDIITAKENTMVDIYTEKGVKGKIVLPDSSVVWLNSDSRIIYPEHFDAKTREILFEGEGFFEVAHNSDWPMHITTSKGMDIMVTGTKFTVRSYKDDRSEQTTLFDGKIIVTKPGVTEKPVEMQPSQTLSFEPLTNNLKLTNKVEVTKQDAWKRGELIFERTPMPEVIKMLERWHGMTIIPESPAVLNHTFTAQFCSESMVQIMELLKFTTNIEYRIDGSTVYLSETK